MDQNLIVLSVVFFAVAIFVGVMKQTWLLAGFNEKRVKDKDKLARIAGFYLFLPLAVLLLIHAFVQYPYDDKILPAVSVAYGVIIIYYVNTKMAE
ncbi:DUF3784 domain-containing protein [Fictibacillus aquaticus]|uniref:DUF3784 domain-containing protein n=1 Tax=Fictibacillus aquaticus TaxID=2021314 RepID=A0A235F8S8_9BACL|nr:DUF3784 domain-containing protein [Fictibacillus aquaticus]OYD57652.1 DUF3784 domain-containing protein [Fictibacillus aquaticus]